MEFHDYLAQIQIRSYRSWTDKKNDVQLLNDTKLVRDQIY
jgi:hypothetical protein